MLKDAALPLNAPPDPIVFVIGIPPGPNACAVSFAQIQNLYGRCD